MSPADRVESTAGSDMDASQRVYGLMVPRCVPEAEVAEARDDVLHLLVADRLDVPMPKRCDAEDMVGRRGRDRSSLEGLWQALGFPEAAQAERTVSDVEAVPAATLFGTGPADLDEIVQLTRVARSSMSGGRG